MTADDATSGLTRRRVLALGAASGVGGVLLGRGATAAPAAVAPRTVGLALPAGAIPGAGRAGTVVRAPVTFDLVGLRGADLTRAHAELRARRAGGEWSPWVPLGSGADHAPDHPQAAPASDPVWVGGADELQLRARHAVRGGRLQLVIAPPPAAPHAAPRAVTSRQATDVQAAARAATPRQAAPHAATPRQAAGVPTAPPIVPRASWGAAAVPPRAAPSYGAVSLAFVHHTVSANDYGPEDSARIVLSIAKYHRDSNGWNDIGYNFLVDRYGQVFEGRAGGVDRAVIGAQAGGWNSQSTGIATIGTFQDVAYPGAALDVVAQLIAWKLTLHGVPVGGTVSLISGGGSENRYPYGQAVVLNRISGHRDGCKTDCPGNALYGQLADLRARVARRAPSSVPAVPQATLVAAAAQVTYGRDVALSGLVLRGDGTPAPSVPVSVQKQTSAGTWVRVATARTGSDGRYALDLTLRRGGVLRAQAQVTAGTAGRARSANVPVGVTPVVTVTAPGPQSRVLAGGGVTLRGRVGPAAPVTIQLERQDRGRWVPAGTVNAQATGGAFTARVALRKAALYRLTALTGPSSARRRSDAVYVRAVKNPSSLRGPGSQGGAELPGVPDGGAEPAGG